MAGAAGGAAGAAAAEDDAEPVADPCVGARPAKSPSMGSCPKDSCIIKRRLRKILSLLTIKAGQKKEAGKLNNKQI